MVILYYSYTIFRHNRRSYRDIFVVGLEVFVCQRHRTLRPPLFPSTPSLQSSLLRLNSAFSLPNASLGWWTCDNLMGQGLGSFFSVQLQNLAGTFDALAFVILCKHLWHPSCTTLSVSQITYDSVKRGLGYLQLFFKFSNSHSSIFTNFRLNLFLEIVWNRWGPTSGFIMDIRPPIWKFSAPLPHIFNWHRRRSIRGTKLSMDGRRRLATRVKKTDYRAKLTLSMDR